MVAIIAGISPALIRGLPTLDTLIRLVMRFRPLLLLNDHDYDYD